MSSPEFPTLEPFGEALCLKGFGHSNEMIRFGYRIAGTDTVLSAIEVPLSVVQQSVPRELSVCLRPNGAVTVSLEYSGRETDFREVSLVELVQELLHPDRLRMEEIKTSDLEVLLRNLEASIKLIEVRMVQPKAS
jgi:hypothetical protein